MQRAPGRDVLHAGSVGERNLAVSREQRDGAGELSVIHHRLEPGGELVEPVGRQADIGRRRRLQIGGCNPPAPRAGRVAGIGRDEQRAGGECRGD